MSAIMIGKAVAVSAGALLISIGGLWLHKSLNPMIEIYGFMEDSSSIVVAAKASSGATDKSTILNKKEVECQITGFKKFWCSVGSVDKLTDDFKKHISLEKLTGSEISTDITGKLEEKKFYKITMLWSDFDKPKPESESPKPAPTADWKTILVFEKGTSTSLGSISVLRKIENGKNIALGSGKTNMFVGQASSISTSSIANYKCAWSTESTSLKPCKIFPFVDANTTDPTQSKETIISKLSFKKTETEITTSTDIKQHRYYLIEFNDSADSKELENFDSTDLIYAKDSSTEKITFSKISAVKVVGEQLLILKESAST